MTNNEWAQVSSRSRQGVAERSDWWVTIESDGVRVYAVDWFGWA